MARLADLLGNAQRTDMFRMAENKPVPKRGKKKHYSQMTPEEKNYLFSKLKAVKKWGISTHALDRIYEKGIEATYSDLVSSIHNSYIIEYHVAQFDGKDDKRVVLRSKARVNRTYNLHVVFSISRQRIVSVWMNHVNDKHSTIDMTDYSRKVKIIGA